MVWMLIILVGGAIAFATGALELTLMTGTMYAFALVVVGAWAYRAYRTARS